MNTTRFNPLRHHSRFSIATAAASGVLAIGGLVVAVPAASATPSSAASDASCPWVHSHAPISSRVSQLMAHMSLDDEITMVHGTAAGAYTGLVAGNAALCIPELKLNDGPVGVRMANTTQLPSGSDLAASFDPDLARSYGKVIGAEDKAKGVNVDLGPTINIVRDPRWGRSFESYSEDPYLTGQIAAGDVQGIQSQGVMAQVKHWTVYNQETNRNTPEDDVVVSDRAVHEIYAKGFGIAIDEAHPASIMCSYSSIHGQFACQSPYLDHILKGDLGFTGFITSDWGATHSTVASANAGLDMEMPGSTYFGAALKTAVQNGQVPRSRLDDMVRRILTQEFRFGLFEHQFPDTPNVYASTPAHVNVARQAAEQGAVLLKNTGNILPLTRRDRSITVIGADAGADTMSHGGGSATVDGTGTVTPLDGIAARAAREGATVRYAQGNVPTTSDLPAIPANAFPGGLSAEYFNNTTLAGAPVATGTSPNVDFNWNGSAPAPGVNATGWSAKWTGQIEASATGTYALSLDAGRGNGARLYVNGKLVINDWSGSRGPVFGSVALTAGHPVSVEVDFAQTGRRGASLTLGWTESSELLAQATQLAKASDVAVVFVGKEESEGADLSDISLGSAQNNLISAVAKANPNTIVVLTTGSAVTMPWLSNVRGVFEAWYAGQQSGNAIAALLYGDVNPSGKLPVTFPKSLAQVPASTPAEWGGVDGKVHYSEGLDVGYRWYDANHLTPLYPFGYGLSYTSFAFSHLHVSRVLTGRGRVQVSARITNTGHRAGADVVQVYLSQPAKAGEPPNQLVGFDKVQLRPHQSRTVHFTLTAQDASRWVSSAQKWVLTPGRYTVRVGDSSRGLPLRSSFRVAR